MRKSLSLWLPVVLSAGVLVGCQRGALPVQPAASQQVAAHNGPQASKNPFQGLAVTSVDPVPGLRCPCRTLVATVGERTVSIEFEGIPTSSLTIQAIWLRQPASNGLRGPNATPVKTAEERRWLGEALAENAKTLPADKAVWARALAGTLGAPVKPSGYRGG